MTLDLGLLSELPPAQQRAVISQMHRHTYRAGETICHEGDPADTMHFVVEGRVVARRASEAGDVHAYSLMGPGQAFGELGMIRPGRRRTVTIEAIERTVTMTLAYADFERLRASHPEVNRLLLRLLVARVDRLTDALMEALHTPAEQRVLRRLLNLCGTYSHRAQGSSQITVSLNQAGLAELAGVTRPTANRVLRRLENEGVVELLRGRITVRDVQALRRAASLPSRP